MEVEEEKEETDVDEEEEKNELEVKALRKKTENGKREKSTIICIFARCLCIPLVSIRVGKINKQGTLLCPTSTSFTYQKSCLHFQCVLLGAITFPADVERLKDLGVCEVITLAEPYETLVTTSLYQAHGINHLVLPTRDYLFASSLSDICQVVDFIHENASCSRATYVHCKVGRGRSTSIVLCYLLQHKQMTSDAAYSYVKSIQPKEVGCFSIVLECVLALVVAIAGTFALRIPTIGIEVGPFYIGQVN
ncbi:putative dual specificity protein phosphatase DSP8 [Camellia lanceoleosa]|uniref:Dual specificity protein phosphatase DSP8 n=1 Tax=Camellia lanceoleosa TaxID=1840588 RepID=A0ACC0HN64_9ERIC|nr:putative dual specificity protein phosphatase DSP8 [Camellia lanceoleosa]